MSREWKPLVYDIEAIREYRTRLVRGQEVTTTTHRKIPRDGELIAWRDRKAYRVITVDEVHQANWHDSTVEAWKGDDMPDPAMWVGRERAVRVIPADQPKAREHGMSLYPWSTTEQWWPLREQYPTCHDCHLIWPCPCDERTTQARAAMAELDRLGGILPGCCWACNEPVTKQQHSIVFDGDNLLLPGGGLVVFHMAESRKAKKGGTCRGWAEKYEDQWVAADPRRPVRLRCAGVLYRHYERSECTEGETCPGVHASHAKYGHCITAMYVGRWVAGTDPELAPGPLTNCGARGCRGPKALAVTDPIILRRDSAA